MTSETQVPGPGPGGAVPGPGGGWGGGTCPFRGHRAGTPSPSAQSACCHPVVQMVKLRLREMQSLAQSHTAS